eukprot:GILI01003078.1.p1 GENE.GILI01003078.1~~GILI01003078.1.p1  ORF type:complete len:582 (+),score=103.07 GILI01003078.1:86-1831(+)
MSTSPPPHPTEATHLSINTTLGDNERHKSGDRSDSEDSYANSSNSSLLSAAIPIHTPKLQPDAPRTRWLVLFVFSLLSASNGFQWINYAPIIDQVKDFFDVDSMNVNFLTTIYTIVYPTTILVGCVVFQKKGSHGGMVLGAFFNALGALIKLVAALWWPTYAPLVISQVVNAFAEVFFLSLPPYLSATWFPAHQRTLATAIGINANAIGSAFGFIIPPAMISDAHKSRWDFAALFGWQAALAVAIVFATLMLPKHPTHHPSVTAAHNSHDLSKIPNSLKYLMTHVPFLLLAFASGLSNDALNTFSSFLAQLLQPFGVSEVEAGWMGFTLTLAGAVFSTIVSVGIDKKRIYKGPMLIVSLGALICFSCQTLVMLYVVDQQTIVGFTFFFVTLMGCFLNVSIPLQFEFAVELTYPHPEGVTTAFLACLAGILTPIITVVATKAVGDNPEPSDAIRFMIGVTFIACVSSTLQLFIKSDLHRVQVEAVAAKNGETQHHLCTPVDVDDDDSVSRGTGRAHAADTEVTHTHVDRPTNSQYQTFNRPTVSSISALSMPSRAVALHDENESVSTMRTDATGHLALPAAP